MTRIDAIGFKDLVVGMIVHHDELGIGKIVELRNEGEGVGIIVAFLFYAPNIMVTEDSIWLVDARDVRVKYRNFEQGHGSLLKLEEVEEDEEDNNNVFNGNAFLLDDKHWSKRRDEFKQRRDGINTEVQAHRATEE